MKRIIFLFGILAISAAHADWLYWVVTQSDIDNSGLSTAIMNSIEGVQIGVVKTGSAASSSDIVEHNYYMSYPTYDAGQEIPIAGTYQQAVAVDVSSFGSSYSFYIELLNESGDVVARTKSNNNQYATYASLSEYIATGSVSDVPAANIWHGGAFEAVPEPSSMALLALGAGLIGLRRKMKKGKKEKRA